MKHWIIDSVYIINCDRGSQPVIIINETWDVSYKIYRCTNIIIFNIDVCHYFDPLG